MKRREEEEVPDPDMLQAQAQAQRILNKIQREGSISQEDDFRTLVQQLKDADKGNEAQDLQERFDVVKIVFSEQDIAQQQQQEEVKEKEEVEEELVQDLLRQEAEAELLRQLRQIEQDLAFARQLLKEEEEKNPLLVSEERAKELKKEQADDDGNAQDALTYEEFDDAPTNQLMELNGRLYFRKTIMDYFIKTALLQNKFIDPFTQEPIDPKILHALIDHFNLPQNILDVDLTNPVYKYLKDIQNYELSGVQSPALDTQHQANKKRLIYFFRERNYEFDME